MAHTFTRQALYDLVWQEPRQQLAKQLGISDVWLAKSCQAANIPMPPRGYWARKSAGKLTTITALPVRGLGQSDRVTIGRPDYRQSDDPLESLLEPPFFPEPVEQVCEQAQRMIGKVRLAQLAVHAHPLITKLLEEDDRRRKDKETVPYSWKDPVFDGPNGKRVLRLLNALFLALARAGCWPTVSSQEGLETGVVVGDTHVSFKIEPVPKREAEKFLKAPKKIPLKLTIKRWWGQPNAAEQSWEDSEKTSLEASLTEIGVALIVAGEMHYRASALQQYQWRVEAKAKAEEALRQKKAEEERIALEKKRALETRQRERLFLQASYYRQAADIRELVKAMELRAELCGAEERMEAFQAWKTLALSTADSIDPLCCPLEDALKI